jgi:hypothetical protein
MPRVKLHIYARFEEGDSFRFEEFSLQSGVGLADQKFSASADHAVPGDTFSPGCGSHGTACGSPAAGEPHSFCERPISNNPSTGNSFHKAIDSVP